MRSTAAQRRNRKTAAATVPWLADEIAPFCLLPPHFFARALDGENPARIIEIELEPAPRFNLDGERECLVGTLFSLEGPGGRPILEMSSRGRFETE